MQQVAWADQRGRGIAPAAQADGELCQPVQVLEACQVMDGVRNYQALKIAEAANTLRQIAKIAMFRTQLPAIAGAKHLRARFGRRMERVGKQDDITWHSSCSV